MKTLYIVLEGILVKTVSGQDIPTGIYDMELNWTTIDWICKQDFTNIVILSNQTWIYGGKGVRNGERFYSKIKYVSECIRESLEKSGKLVEVSFSYSIRKPWIHGLDDSGPDLIKSVGLDPTGSIFLCRPIPFDLDYAKLYPGIQVITKI